ncbi:MFS transporter [Halorarius litoreus]|uniref:MFS transporter n=1 Tax=Halorarius litoreus TaxID=2962676 RepID=UPI0020CC6331|nr:MFS transporter [Halorarius litoreus]
MPQRPPRALRYAPHLAALGSGYTMFAYAGVPALFRQRYEVGFAAIGLVMSAALLGFVLVQWPSGRVLTRVRTTRLLFGTAVANVVLALALDVAPTYPALLALRFLWGGTYGLVVTAGATHISRLYPASAATRQQGIFGGMSTLGGAVGFLVAPQLVTATDGVGVHAGGVVFVLPAVVALGVHWSGHHTAPPDTDRQRGTLWRAAQDPIVLASSLCYVAVIGSYITLSTFVTSYFDDLGITGPLNAVVLGVATTGRIVGDSPVSRLSVGNATFVAGATAVACAGFGALAGLSTGATMVWLPFVVMLAVSIPFGAIYNIAAQGPRQDGAALAVVIAVGNAAALVLPAVTGALREVTGDYRGAFVLLATLNLVAVASALTLRRKDTPNTG